MGQTSIQHIAGNIGNGEYPATKQALFNEFVANLRSFLPAGRGEFIISSNTPTDRDVIWVELSTAGVFLGLRRWDGTAWVSMAPPNQTVTTVTTTPYAVLSTARVLLVDTSSAKVVNLDNPATRAGKLIFIQDSTGQAGSNNITVNAYAATTLHGVTSKVINLARGGMIVVSDGINDYIVGGLFERPSVTVTIVTSTPYTQIATDSVLAVVTGVPMVIQLSDPALRTGRIFHVKDRTGAASGGNPITITAFGATTINGAATKVINTAWGGVSIVSDGTNDLLIP